MRGDFASWIDSLAERHKISDIDRLREVIESVGLNYDGTQYWGSELHGGDNLDELPEPLSRVIELLSDERNEYRLIKELSADADAQCDVGMLSDRFYDLVRELDKIRLVALRAHVSVPRGRPKAKDLYDLVESLAEYWEEAADQPFTQDWHPEGGIPKPVSKGAIFVYDVTEYIDPKRLPELPNVTRKVVTKRRELAKNKPIPRK